MALRHIDPERGCLIALAIATPVAEWASRGESAGSVMFVGGDVVYLEFSGGIVALTSQAVPKMPNGVSVGTDAGLMGLCETGDQARLHPEGIDAGELHVRWPWPTSVWEPQVAQGPWPIGQVMARGRRLLRYPRDVGDSLEGQLLGAMVSDGVPLVLYQEGADATVALFDALARRDPTSLRQAATNLLGRGSGLTPEGDDLLTAAAVTIVAFGRSVGLNRTDQDDLVEALTSHPAGRTTALSATLIELAAAGRPIEPVGTLLNIDDDRRLEEAIGSLRSIGHTSGRIYTRGIGATATALSHRLPGDGGPRPRRA